MDNWITQIDAWLVALVLAAAMLAGWGIAWWWTASLAPTDPDDPSTGRFVDGSLALLALLLGFTFAMALNKHEQRRAMVIADSNGIGDFYACASLLKEPGRSELQRVIREYLDHRLEVARTAHDLDDLEGAVGRAQAMHARMSKLVADAVDGGTPVAVPLVNTYNGLTSNNAARLAAVRDRIPKEVMFLLFLTSITASVLVGRHHGLRHKPHVASTISYILIVVSAVYVIVDLSQPTGGLIRVSQESLERLAASMAGH